MRERQTERKRESEREREGERERESLIQEGKKRDKSADRENANNKIRWLIDALQQKLFSSLKLETAATCVSYLLAVKTERCLTLLIHCKTFCNVECML